MKRLCIAALGAALLCAAPSGAGEPPPEWPPYIRVLLPIYFRAPRLGAHDSTWKTEITILNRGEHSIVVGDYLPGCDFDPCPPSWLDPGVTIFPQIPDRAGDDGAFMFIQADGAEAVDISLRVSEESSDNGRSRFSIPCPTENAFSGETIQLSNVLLASGYRGTLRAYALDGAAGDTVRVVAYRIFPSNSRPIAAVNLTPDEHVFTRVLALRKHPNGYFDWRYPLFADLTGLENLVNPGDHIRFEVSPMLPAQRIWAFVSVTGNVSQQVEIAVPD